MMGQSADDEYQRALGRSSVTTAFITQLLQRCAKMNENQKVSDSEYRVLTENLIDDWLKLYLLPEWPAAEPILHLCTLALVGVLEDTTSPPNLRAMAVDLLGRICCRLRRELLELDRLGIKMEPRLPVTPRRADGTGAAPLTPAPSTTPAAGSVHKKKNGAAKRAKTTAAREETPSPALAKDGASGVGEVTPAPIGAERSPPAEAVVVIPSGTLPDEQGETYRPCLCGKTYEQYPVFMLACDVCGWWLHGECVGVDEDHPPETFKCDECRAKTVAHSQDALKAEEVPPASAWCLVVVG